MLGALLLGCGFGFGVEQGEIPTAVSAAISPTETTAPPINRGEIATPEPVVLPTAQPTAVPLPSPTYSPDLADWTVLVYMAASGALLLGITGAPLRYFLLQQRAESARRETLLSIEAARRDFESRLARAMDMADDEASALHAAMQAMGTMVDDALVEVLLADSSRAHLAIAASSEGGDGADGGETLRGCGCDVATPRSCPAIHAARRSADAVSWWLPSSAFVRTKDG